MNQLEDDIRSVLRSQADAMQVPEAYPGSPTLRLIDPQHTPTRRNLWPIAVAAAIIGIAVGGLVIATREEELTREVATATQPPLVAQPPVEFTACLRGGADNYRSERIVLPDGETTIDRVSNPIEVTATDVSDPRLHGTWSATEINDHYNAPGNDDLIIGTWTHRIENADGAWQGSHQTIDFPDGQVHGGYEGLYVMTGEGAYEGLTAYMVLNSQGTTPDCPTTTARGYITPSA